MYYKYIINKKKINLIFIMKDDKPIIYKFVFLGESGVGKSSIFRKMLTGNFTEFIISTIGADKKSITYTNVDVENKGNKYKKDFEISIFDTAGQERYRSLATNYIKNSDGLVLVYDITNKKSFELIEKWLESILEILPDWKDSEYLIILLGNKLDLIGQEEEDRKVKAIEAKNLCDKKGILWGGECSAKDFTEQQLSNLFKYFTVKVFNKIGIKDTDNIQNLKKMKKSKKRRRC